MIRASERAAEQAKKRRALETKLIAATLAESDAEALVRSSANELQVRRDRFIDASAVRKRIADELAEASK